MPAHVRPPRKRRRALRNACLAAALLALSAAAFAAWLHARAKASLPQLDGAVTLAGLGADASVERDALGAPVIRAANRADAARALGFLHAQDRFFQMDLLRRRPSGELAELFGKRAVEADKAMRLHRLRAHARDVYAALPAARRALVDAYAGGVNAGLAALGARPPEYLLLRVRPAPWLPEDCVLVICAMAVDLQHPDARHELSLMTARDLLHERVVRFFAPLVAPNDAALDGTTAPLPAMPEARHLNVRRLRSGGGSQRSAGIPARDLPDSGLPARDSPASDSSARDFADSDFPAAPTSDFPTRDFADSDFPASDFPARDFPARDFAARDFATSDFPAPDFADNASPASPAAPARLASNRGATQGRALRGAFVSPARAPVFSPRAPVFPAGSNNMALAGALTASGAALLENDMHLALRVPNTWYRARMTWTADDGSPRDLAGVTLPGLPALVAGSNGRIAWGFTNSCADTSDIVVLTPVEITPDYYSSGRKIVRLEDRTETIRVRGGGAVTFTFQTSEWGPVIGENHKAQRLSFKWVLREPGALDLEVLGLEDAASVAEAVDVARRSGIPAQNFLVADSAGAIGWTICGRLPNRAGFDGRFPATWAYGDRRWDGLVPPEKIPALINPPGGRLSSANQRLFGGGTLALLGDGGLVNGLRGARIQNLMADIAGEATPGDLLAVALDDRAPHLDRWRGLFLKTLAAAGADVAADADAGAAADAAVDADAVAAAAAAAAADAAAADAAAAGSGAGAGASPRRRKDRDALARALAGENGPARASVDSVSYTIVSRFRGHVADRALAPVFARCLARYPDFDYTGFNYEPGLWELLEKRPAHLLAPEYASWDALLLAAADDVSRDIKAAGLEPATARWGEFNTSRIHHPLGGVLFGLLGGWLNLPADPLPGGADTPRLQSPAHGASERFVVAPGREGEGIFHMPGGQSGHPLSPFYRAGHDAWVHGRPTPFLPGPAMHVLTLRAENE
ncbi:MAG: penicillin acylase family protein [Opitutaceae bacterium]|jgi:penicillin amidase|nr:penicillin acylase family protein [Opitutaceae bacterium]